MSRSKRYPTTFETKQRRIAKHNMMEEERRNSKVEINKLLDVPFGIEPEAWDNEVNNAGE